MKKAYGCLVGGVIVIGIGALLIRPWQPDEVGITEMVLGDIATRRPCVAVRTLIDQSRLECIEEPLGNRRLMSKVSGVSVTSDDAQNAAIAPLLIGYDVEILRKEEDRAWLYQSELDMTFAANKSVVVDFAAGKVTSDEFFSGRVGVPEVEPLSSAQ